MVTSGCFHVFSQKRDIGNFRGQSTSSISVLACATNSRSLCVVTQILPAVFMQVLFGINIGQKRREERTLLRIYTRTTCFVEDQKSTLDSTSPTKK